MATLRLSITTPPGWWDLPLDPSGRDGEITALVDERYEGEDPEERTALIELLKKAAASAHAAGAVLASQLGVVGASFRFAVSMAVAVRRVARPPGMTLAQLVQAMTTSEADGVVDMDVVVDSLDVGKAGRVTRRRCNRLVRFGGEAGISVLCVQYFAELPATPSIAVVMFTSPTFSAARELLVLFDGIAATLQFEYFGAPGS